MPTYYFHRSRCAGESGKQVGPGGEHGESWFNVTNIRCGDGNSMSKKSVQKELDAARTEIDRLKMELEWYSRPGEPGELWHMSRMWVRARRALGLPMPESESPSAALMGSIQMPKQTEAQEPDPMPEAPVDDQA